MVDSIYHMTTKLENVMIVSLCTQLFLMSLRYVTKSVNILVYCLTDFNAYRYMTLRRDVI